MNNISPNAPIKNIENLCNAIVMQAALDYCKILRVLQLYPRDSEALKIKNELESFFHSEWYEKLTGINADYLIRKMKEFAQSNEPYKKLQT